MYLYLRICICVFVYETLGNISFDILGPIVSENVWFVWSKVEISGDVTEAGQTTNDDKQGKIELLSF